MVHLQSQISIGLVTVGFEAYFEGVDIGPLTGTDLYLAAMTTTTEHLVGRITSKSSSSGPDTLFELPRRQEPDTERQERLRQA